MGRGWDRRWKTHFIHTGISFNVKLGTVNTRCLPRSDRQTAWRRSTYWYVRILHLGQSIGPYTSCFSIARKEDQIVWW